MKRKVVSILLTGAMLVSMPAAQVFAEEAEGGEQTVVKFQTWNPGEGEVTDQLIAMFEEEHPDIKIDYTYMPYTDHVEKLKVVFPPVMQQMYLVFRQVLCIMSSVILKKI